MELEPYCNISATDAISICACICWDLIDEERTEAVKDEFVYQQTDISILKHLCNLAINTCETSSTTSAKELAAAFTATATWELGTCEYDSKDNPLLSTEFTQLARTTAALAYDDNNKNKTKYTPHTKVQWLSSAVTFIHKHAYRLWNKMSNNDMEQCKQTLLNTINTMDRTTQLLTHAILDERFTQKMTETRIHGTFFTGYQNKYVLTKTTTPERENTLATIRHEESKTDMTQTQLRQMLEEETQGTKFKTTLCEKQITVNFDNRKDSEAVECAFCEEEIQHDDRDAHCYCQQCIK